MVRKKIWIDGKILNEGEANVPLTSDVSLRGISVFEGLLAYNCPDLPRHAVVSLSSHVERLSRSAELMELTCSDIRRLVEEGIRELASFYLGKDIYLRPTIYLASGSYGKGETSKLFVVSREFSQQSSQLVRCMISTYKHISPDAYPSAAKIGAMYAFYRLARIEAMKEGYDESILLTRLGEVTETPGASIFSVKHGKVYTPPISVGILPSITRLTVIEMLRNQFDLEVLEEKLLVEDLLSSEEVFLAGTLDEIKTVQKINNCEIGCGLYPLSSKLRSSYVRSCRYGVPTFPKGTKLFECQ